MTEPCSWVITMASRPKPSPRSKVSVTNLATATNILYAKGCELADGLPSFTRIPAAALSHDGAPGLKANYYNNKDFNGNILFTTIDSVLDDNWGDGAPRNDMDDDNFGVKWSGELTPDKSGPYQLGIITTCKVKLYLDDSLVAFTSYHFRDEYNDPRLRKSIPLTLKGGKKYRLRADVSESYGDARVQLVWWHKKPAAPHNWKPKPWPPHKRRMPSSSAWASPRAWREKKWM